MEWAFDFSAARNRVITIAEESKCDYMLMLDSDEMVYKAEMDALLANLGKLAYTFPRYNMTGQELTHWRPDLYPDQQTRLFKLNVGCRYRGKVHESLYGEGDDGHCLQARGKTVILNTPHIYHYGYCKPEEETWIRHHMYNCIRSDTVGDVVDAAPEGTDTSMPKGVPFLMHHPALSPLSPHELELPQPDSDRE